MIVIVDLPCQGQLVKDLLLAAQVHPPIIILGDAVIDGGKGRFIKVYLSTEYRRGVALFLGYIMGIYEVF